MIKYYKEIYYKRSIFLNYLLYLIQSSETAIHIAEINFAYCIFAQFLCHVHIRYFLLSSWSFRFWLVFSENILMAIAVLITQISSFFKELYCVLTIIKINLRTSLLYKFLYFCFVNVILWTSNLCFILIILYLRLVLKLCLWLVLWNVMLGRGIILRKVKILLIKILVIVWLVNLWLNRGLYCRAT